MNLLPSPSTEALDAPQSTSEFLDGEGLLLTRLNADWQYIRPTVEFARVSVAIRTSEDQGDRIALILHELLENAVKYGGLGEDIRLELRLRLFSGFQIRVSNRAVATRVSLLRNEVERLGSMPPPTAFAEALKRAGSLPEGASMIGLSRITHEGRVQIEVLFDQRRVTVIARGRG